VIINSNNVRRLFRMILTQKQGGEGRMISNSIIGSRGTPQSTSYMCIIVLVVYVICILNKLSDNRLSVLLEKHN